ncbi:MAG TPA: hypothetical protein VN174_01935 [Candidatus Methanoperedens sp.]|nr:hypothetical protein [Candidatus Methanoperedens sp.]
MVRIKLEDLRREILNYIGVPYHTNVPKVISTDNVVVGKGNAKEIALKTIEVANEHNIKLIDLTAQQIYNLQKKNKIGIDCSGLACHLLNFCFNQKIDVRRTSAEMLTSPPISRRIDVHDIQTADLIRQKSGHHVLFVIEKIGNKVIYVDSSRLGRGVRYGEFEINDQKFKHEGIFRLVAS